MTADLRNFLAIPYEELEEMNLKIKEQRKNRVAAHKIQEERLKYLTDEKRIKAVTLLFSDLEGRLHMLDYDKKFLVRAGTTSRSTAPRSAALPRSVRATCACIDWGAFYQAPADVFGTGKVPVFGEVIEKAGGPYSGRPSQGAEDITQRSSTRRTGTP